ncbi:hypothetical protein EV192_102996 [Actinocrispum wychmicini]|uniref:Uncharacterized protein n=1 Tax=Actinocrispum wychmicini TaxID=1213861 RepID=A0A4R2JUH7_9PSEU|nr:hypothetical protein EV192_102996 [Actinocrispum wychmicini]
MHHRMSAGSSETDVNELIVMAIGSRRWTVVITVTSVA